MLVWNVHKITEVPITATGIHATRADLRGRGRPLAPTSQPASTQPVGPAPAATTAPATQSSESPADHSLVGRWMTRRAAPAGTTFYFQFDPNGSCAFATQTGTGSVVPRFGHYQVKGDYVIIYVDHGDAAVQKMRYVMLHIVWGGAGPQLEGDLAPEPALQALRIPLERANFPDMNVTVPKPTP